MLNPNQPSFETRVQRSCNKMNLDELRQEMLRLKKLGSVKRLPLVERAYDSRSWGSGQPRWLVYSEAGYKVVR